MNRNWGIGASREGIRERGEERDSEKYEREREINTRERERDKDGRRAYNMSNEDGLLYEICEWGSKHVEKVQKQHNVSNNLGEIASMNFEYWKIMKKNRIEII